MARLPQKDARSLYHRWRSSNFSEVVAQEHVTRTLKNAVSRGRIVHAYLFCGPRGTGKTSTARILAKAANCLDPQDGEPCNVCVSCVTVNEGRAIDLIEIDAASNRGIDDARELREKIKFSPAESRYKVYIIDEAHMLTSEASNALLKTLEEPPEHAILILATTESHKILATISSRCQRFDFRRIPLQDIVSQLEMICREEGLVAEAGVLDRVARMARGSLRDAESLLDQLVAYCGEEIQLNMAREVLGLTGEESVPDIADAVRAGDLVLGLRLIDGLASTGADLRHFSRELVDYLRALVVVKSGAETSLVLEYRADETARLRASAEGWDYRRLLAAIRSFTELDGRMRQEAFGQVQLEMAFMEAALWRESAPVPDVADARREAERLSVAPAGREHRALTGESRTAERPAARPAAGDKPPVLPGTAAGDKPPVLPSTAGDKQPASPVAGDAKVGQTAPVVSDVVGGVPTLPDEAAVDSPDVAAAAEPATPVALDLASVKANWSRVLAEVRGLGSLGIASALQGAQPIEVVGTTVSLGLNENPLWKNTLERPGVREKVASAFSAVFGVKLAVKFHYGFKLKRETVPPERDPVVETAVRELGFEVARVEPASDQ